MATETTTLSVRLPKRTLEQLRLSAQTRGVSVNQLVASTLSAEAERGAPGASTRAVLADLVGSLDGVQTDSSTVTDVFVADLVQRHG